MSTTEEIASAVRVEFDFTPETVIGRDYRQIGEEEWAETPITLGDHVAALIAKDLASQIKKELRESSGYNYRNVAEEAVESAARERVESALSKLTQPTDVFGSPKGSEKTIAELIDDKITSWFNSKGDSYGKGTNLQQLIEKAVDRQIKTEMNKAVEDAKKKVLAALTAEAQAQMQKAFADVVAAQVKA